MAIAATGTVTGNPVLAGLGFMSMFTTEYGNGYLGAIKQGLTNDKKEISEENILDALSTGKYAGHAEAAAFAALSASSEYIGASGVAKATMKAMGVVGDLKKVTASLYRGEAKAFVKQAAKAAKRQVIAGAGEGLTEFAQGNFGQMSIGTQLTGIQGIGDYIDTKENMTSAIVGFAMGSLIPFGGYVKMFGDKNPASITDKKDSSKTSNSVTQYKVFQTKNNLSYIFFILDGLFYFFSGWAERGLL
jgi:hypothetical protein